MRSRLKQIFECNGHGCGTFREKTGNEEKNKSKALFKSYVDAVVSAENMWWDIQQVAGKKGLTGKEILSRVKRTISLVSQGKKKVRLKIA